ncbi:MAG TPA: hypothetical protein VH189_15600 [Rhizomicrobium sp.]|jgi:hypothetical protein|nr:hypothetical protein [Rhizomicrobium sp.]
MTDVPRQVANALMRHATWVMPSSDKAWGDAMQNEMQSIEEDREALRWAVGCLIASYGERTLGLLHSRPARWTLASLTSLLAMREFFAPAMVMAYRLQDQWLLQLFGAQTAGHDYHRFTPLLETVPSWILMFWIVSGLLYVGAIWRLLRKAGAAYVPFFLALIMDMTGSLMNRPFEIASGVVVNPHALVNAGAVLLPCLMGMMFWGMARGPSRLSS